MSYILSIFGTHLIHFNLAILLVLTGQRNDDVLLLMNSVNGQCGRAADVASLTVQVTVTF